MAYPGNVTSQFTCSLLFDAVNDLTIYGTKGHVRIHPKFWESTKATLAVGGKEILAAVSFRRNGFEYQIEEAMRCVRGRRGESEGMPLAATLANMKTMDQIREQIALKYSYE
jgi:predicted dehydrogenase